jgi:hypothetical protein
MVLISFITLFHLLQVLQNLSILLISLTPSRQITLLPELTGNGMYQISLLMTDAIIKCLMETFFISCYLEALPVEHHELITTERSSY